MLQPINAIKFTNTNAYTNQNKNPKTQYSQQSFGKSPSKTISLISAFLISLCTMGTKAAEKASKIKPKKLDAICAKCEPLEATSPCLIDVPKEFQATGGDIVPLRMNRTVLAAFEQLRAAVRKELQVDLVIRSAYRDDGYVTRVTEEMERRKLIDGADIFFIDELEHGTGCEPDVTVKKTKTSKAEGEEEEEERIITTITDVMDDKIRTWLAENAEKYGFLIPQKTDAPQHLKYTGKKQKPPEPEQPN